ncbi:MAG TPA: hypothetical protein VFW94_23575 [Candidatus Acidoferrales bacterium]|nr:hypothetical protein [Candidatus Acidoferrales bacterium]
MGYTHYYYVNKKGIPPSVWAAICADVRKLIAKLPAHSTTAGGYHSSEPLAITYEDDDPRPPQIDVERIRFNGTGYDDASHETFILERKPPSNNWGRDEDGMAFDCCKTARKPYDLVVCAALIVARAHAGPLIDVSSDGDLEDWLPALTWTAEVLAPTLPYIRAFSEIFKVEKVPYRKLKTGAQFIQWLQTTKRLGALERSQEPVF